MTLTTAPSAIVGAPPTGLSVVVALARFEGRRMLAHPVMWVGLLSSGAFAVIRLAGEAPVLNRVSMILAWTMAPLAAAVALVAGWAVLRAGGRTDEGPSVITPVAMSHRVAGILLGLTLPAMTTLALQFGLLAWVMTQDPVTSLVWAELLVGPTYVVFAGGFAVAMSRWVPHASTPLFTLLVLAGLHLVVTYNPPPPGSPMGVDYLVPVVWPETIVPYELSLRPSGLHLGYLAGLLVVSAGISVLSRRGIGWILLGLGVFLAATLGPAQLGPIEESRRVEAISRLVGDRADLTCQTHHGVTYCAMPGYEGWIDDWMVLAEPMLAAAPSEASMGIDVRQYPMHNTILLIEGQDVDDWWWIEPSYEDLVSRDVVPAGSVLQPRSNFQEVVHFLALEVVGCDRRTECQGAAQNVTLLWLLVHTPGVRFFIIDDPDEHWSVTECMVAELWGRPGADDLVRGNWEVLSHPETTYQEAGAILGVSVPSGYDENESLAGGCP